MRGMKNYKLIHCVKRARVRSYSGPHFPRIFPHSDWIRRDTISPYSVRMRENTDTFYAIIIIIFFLKHLFVFMNYLHFRNSHRKCSVKKVFLKIFAKFTGKHLCQSLFLNKIAGLRPATLLKKRPWHRCFPVSFAKFLRTPPVAASASSINNTSLIIEAESLQPKYLFLLFYYHYYFFFI